jgi:hypothetical protein
MKNITIDFPVKINYFNVQLEIMSIASEEKNAGTESKCSNTFSKQDIKSIL